MTTVHENQVNMGLTVVEDFYTMLMYWYVLLVLVVCDSDFGHLIPAVHQFGLRLTQVPLHLATSTRSLMRFVMAGS